jgi:hypothetical protein
VREKQGVKVASLFLEKKMLPRIEIKEKRQFISGLACTRNKN